MVSIWMLIVYTHFNDRRKKKFIYNNDDIVVDCALALSNKRRPNCG